MGFVRQYVKDKILLDSAQHLSDICQADALSFSTTMFACEKALQWKKVLEGFKGLVMTSQRDLTLDGRVFRYPNVYLPTFTYIYQ